VPDKQDNRGENGVMLAVELQVQQYNNRGANEELRWHAREEFRKGRETTVSFSQGL
jgi:hypothetical protein